MTHLFILQRVSFQSRSAVYKPHKRVFQQWGEKRDRFFWRVYAKKKSKKKGITEYFWDNYSVSWTFVLFVNWSRKQHGDEPLRFLVHCKSCSHGLVQWKPLSSPPLASSLCCLLWYKDPVSVSPNQSQMRMSLSCSDLPSLFFWFLLENWIIELLQDASVWSFTRPLAFFFLFHVLTHTHFFLFFPPSCRLSCGFRSMLSGSMLSGLFLCGWLNRFKC